MNLNKLRFKLSNNDGMGDSDSIRYESKISLCQLVFDLTNSILYIAHGRKITQVEFAGIVKFEVFVNINCVLKVAKGQTAVFNAETEESLRFVLSEVEQEDLCENETRELLLKISYESGTEVQSALINFYYREGGLRLSSNSFAQSVDDMMLWCDLLETAIRPVENEQLVDDEAGILDPADQPETEPEPVPVSVPAQQNNYHLADELVKLADLREKGFLTDAEFQQAKYKIINS